MFLLKSLPTVASGRRFDDEQSEEECSTNEVKDEHASRNIADRKGLSIIAKSS